MHLLVGYKDGTGYRTIDSFMRTVFKNSMLLIKICSMLPQWLEFVSAYMARKDLLLMSETTARDYECG